MTQTSNRFFDEMARLMNDAAGVAQGVRREFDTLFRTQAERILRDLDVVQREEFEAVKEMARLAREENEALKARIAALEAKTAGLPGAKDPPATDFSSRFPCLSGLPARYKPARSRPPAPLEACRVRGRPENAAFLHTTRGSTNYGDRQRNQSDGASERRQGGRPGRASRRPCAGRDLRRQQTPADGLARPRRAAAAHLCRALPHHALRSRCRRHEASRRSRATSSSIRSRTCRCMWTSCGSAKAP